jgi:tRNA nucleotidyltransferase (CCA-adding enzyme)
MAGVCCVADLFPLEKIKDEVRDIARTLSGAGHEAWYVGGAVRDTLLAAGGREVARIGDFDVATSASPAQVQALFRRTVPVGIEHGTVAVLDTDGAAHEVTTFRRDVKTDGRHAVVEFGVSLDDDLARRDFTINAIAVHPGTGEIRDPFGGRADLAAGVVRAVGDPATRFREDRLRVLRALRFAAAFGFQIEPLTWDALRAAVSDLDALSRERVRDEWVKMLEAGSPTIGVGLWRKAGVLERVWPEMAEMGPDVPGRLDAVDPPRDPVLLTAAALWHCGATGESAEAAARRLKFSNVESARVRAVVSGLSVPMPTPGAARDVRHWLASHRSFARDILAVAEPRSRRADLVAAVRGIEASGDPLTVRDLAVSGDDLQAAGVQPGKAMGEILKKLLEEVLDEPWRNTREHLLSRVKELS